MMADVAPQQQHEVPSHVVEDQPMSNDSELVVPANADAFVENKSLPSDAPAAPSALELEEASVTASLDAPSTTTQLVEESVSGIAPTAPFVPEDAVGHATPDPTQTLVDPVTDVDTKMEDAVDYAAPAVEDSAASMPTPEAEEESVPMADEIATIEMNGTIEASQDPLHEPAAPQTLDSTEASAMPPHEANVPSGTVRPREDDEADEPSAKRSKVEDQDAAPEAPQPEFKVPDVPERQDAAAPTMNGDVASSSAVEKPVYSTSPMTAPQKQGILERMKNLKKVKAALWFLKPVDYVTLGIPSYPEIIKQPMDLGTMEKKLKEDGYASVADFVADFELILSNAIAFNGVNHPVTVAAQNMEAYFRRQMETLPRPDAPAQQKVASKSSPPAKVPPPQRRESRSAAATVQAPTSGESFALQADGTPQIRRDSGTNRPARAIRPPPSRELAYAKPKRKEHQLELKFCEHVLDDLRSPRHKAFNGPFLVPVDPVALNIPHYRSVIKHPMDMQTMSQKLKTGQYGTAKEVVKDFNLIVENSHLFNPEGNPVRHMAAALKSAFDRVWATKDKWERKNQSVSQPASSASVDESDADESEEDEDGTHAQQSAVIATLTKKLAEMQNTLASVAGKAVKPTKQKKSKSKPTAKRIGSISAVPSRAKAAKPKRTRQVTYEEKQEISSAVDRMTPDQTEVLTRIITDNCAKYRDMGDEMELEIDDLPNDLQLMLLEHVRKLFGNPNKSRKAALAAGSSPEDGAAPDDEDFEPPERARGAAGKRKKNRPMGKKEQVDTINNIKQQLAQFDTQKTIAVSAGESPAAHRAEPETSGDDPSEESEEE